VVPDIIHGAGDIGKEPIIRVLGYDPLEVVDKALRLAEFSFYKSLQFRLPPV